MNKNKWIKYKWKKYKWINKNERNRNEKNINEKNRNERNRNEKRIIIIIFFVRLCGIRRSYVINIFIASCACHVLLILLFVCVCYVLLLLLLFVSVYLLYSNNIDTFEYRISTIDMLTYMYVRVYVPKSKYFFLIIIRNHFRCFFARLTSVSHAF